jgi:hypothetical protein
MPPKKRKTKQEEKKEDLLFSQFIDCIEKQCNVLNGEYGSISHYTSINIDGINLNIFIRKKNNNYNYMMESILVSYEDEFGDDEYIIFLKKEKFKTLADLLNDIKEVINTYHFVDHKLLSPEQFLFANMQRSFFPLSKDKECSICYESTKEYTKCKHPICYKCRESSISNNNSRCPICRNDNLKEFPEELIFTQCN